MVALHPLAIASHSGVTAAAAAPATTAEPTVSQYVLAGGEPDPVDPTTNSSSKRSPSSSTTSGSCSIQQAVLERPPPEGYKGRAQGEREEEAAGLRLAVSTMAGMADGGRRGWDIERREGELSSRFLDFGQI